MITIEGLSLNIGSFELERVAFAIPTGEYGILMGKTGCGKTTILEAICGLRAVRAGRVLLDDRDVTNTKPAERNVGYVPQDGALFSTMTVREHLTFSLRIRNAHASLIEERVSEMADLLGIESLLDRMPPGLSGGEAQRVSLGRALANHPNILCLDEPLSALDESTRLEMYDLLESIQARTGVTTLHVTHSRSEARRLGDRVFWIEDGTVARVALDRLENQGMVKSSRVNDSVTKTSDTPSRFQ